MAGNVLEWVYDGYASYPYQSLTDPVNLLGSDRVFRGGSWDGIARGCRAAYRYSFGAGNRGDYLCFRLSRSL